MALPEGLALMTFHQALLGHLTNRPVTTLERMAADAEAVSYGGPAAVPYVPWSHDGRATSCFERVCLWGGGDVR